MDIQTQQLRTQLQKGLVIPAHPLALDAQRKLDERRQRALTRYYLAAGVGGVAVGVHTTQFAIRNPKVGLFRPVLELAAGVAKEGATATKPLLIAGICGATEQAVGEARLARDLGYDAGLLSLAALKTETTEGLLQHCRAVAEVIPVMGFYLQPAVGGRVLPFQFWREFAEIENVVAIKIAPFNRYQTLDVVRAVAESGRAGEIALYTGNDDNIVADLLTSYTFVCGGREVTQQIVGGLLGHWSVWTQCAVQQHAAIRALIRSDESRVHSDEMQKWLAFGVQITDANAAFFDAANAFRGCIAGLHEVLRRQGLFEGRWCLDSDEELSADQQEAIDRVYAAYPHLHDDEFVIKHRDEWLA